MCGRFTLLTPFEALLEHYNIEEEMNKVEYEAHYNIAPSQQITAVINNGEANKIGRLRWGLIPPWAKDEKIAYKMINARAETLAEKPSFKQPLRSKRCLIPADGFYEWKKAEDGTKQPMRITLHNEALFSFAGLWEKWLNPEGKAIFTCTIITTAANSLMKEIHHRMPVILGTEQEKKWLDPKLKDLGELNALLTPYPAEEMKAYPVSNLVNSPKNNTADLVNPL